MAGTFLLNAVDADTDGASHKLPAPGSRWREHRRSVFVYGDDFGGGTVTIQVSPDGSTWFTARDSADQQASFSQGDHVVIWCLAPFIRARLTGATNPSNVSAVLFPDVDPV